MFRSLALADGWPMEIPMDSRARTTFDWLIARGGELRARVRRVEKNLRRTRKGLKSDPEFDGLMLENAQILTSIVNAARCELSRLDRALDRFAAGAFASCEHCGGGIPESRIVAIPYATACRGCRPEV
jgi:DnaK suppressor protein